MEHRLILGGEQYLPFARSRIKALRATGLAYASQKFYMGDAIVRVRIEPGYEYINTEGGGCILQMDSGVVDVGNISEKFLPVSAYLPGKWFETDYVGDYNTAFTKTSEDGLLRTNPEKQNENQMSGSVNFRPNSIRGAVGQPDSDAKSFSSAKEGNSYKENDEVLLLKKLTAMACPASIFTGRCRLYVQSLYGRPLYEKATQSTYIPQLADGEPPFLKIKAYKLPGDETEYDDVVVTTSVGVTLDDLTGKHYLFQIGSYVRMHPLIGNRCAEGLRKYLVPGTKYGTGPKASAFDKDERARLESYILSTCLPDVKNSVDIGGAPASTSVSMGYGWHWNYSGTAADIVENEIFQQEGHSDFSPREAMRSTHKQISIIKTSGGLDESGVQKESTFSTSHSVVEGPVEWGLERTQWVLLEPWFQKGTLLKSTPKFSVPFVCDAPFYAFYVGDDLKICRSKRYQESVPAKRTQTPFFDASPNPGEFPGGSDYGMTHGFESGWSEDDYGSIGHWVAEITVGSLSTGKMFRGKQHDIDRREVGDKTSLGSWRVVYHGEFRPYDFTVLEGPPNEAAGPPGEYSPKHLGPGWDDGTFAEGVAYSFSKKRMTDYYYGSAAIVVPFYDSEAVYMWSLRGKSRTGTEESGRFSTTSTLDSASFPLWSQRVGFISAIPIGGPYAPIKYYYFTSWAAAIIYRDVGNPRTLEPVAFKDLPLVEDIDVEQRLVCAAGTLDVQFPGLAAVFDNTTEVAGPTYATFSGVVKGPKAVVVTQGFENDLTHGILDRDFWNPVVVGWA